MVLVLVRLSILYTKLINSPFFLSPKSAAKWRRLERFWWNSKKSLFKFRQDIDRLFYLLHISLWVQSMKITFHTKKLDAYFKIFRDILVLKKLFFLNFGKMKKGLISMFNLRPQLGQISYFLNIVLLVKSMKINFHTKKLDIYFKNFEIYWF